MQVNVHGCRGSIPSCSEETVGYGGNTSCYEIRFDDFQLIIDTGSGFRTVKLDPDLEKVILYSHWHHDHIQGLPFNSDIFNSANEIALCSALSTKRPFRHTLQTYFSGGYFPVDIVTVLKNLKFINVSELQQKFKTDFKLDWLELNHPGGSAGYSVHHQDKKFCYLCDNEYETSQLEALTIPDQLPSATSSPSGRLQMALQEVLRTCISLTKHQPIIVILAYWSLGQ